MIVFVGPFAAGVYKMRDARQRLVHCGTNALWWPFQAAAVGVQVGALVFMFYSVHVGVLLLEGGFCGGLCRCLSVAWALVSARDLAGTRGASVTLSRKSSDAYRVYRRYHAQYQR